MAKLKLTSRIGVETYLIVTEYIARRIESLGDEALYYIREDLSNWHYGYPSSLLTKSQCKRLYYFFGKNNCDYFVKLDRIG